MGKSVADKMAAIEAAADQAVGGDVLAAVNGDSQRNTFDGHLDPEQLQEMTVKELTALAEDMGLEVRRGIRKAELVEMISAERVQVPAGAVEPEETHGEETAQTQEEENTGGDAPEAQEEEKGGDTSEEQEKKSVGSVEMIQGRVLVTYTGMVNLRDANLRVVSHAMQGQSFPVICKGTKDGATWYMIEDREGKLFWISGEVVKFMK